MRKIFFITFISFLLTSFVKAEIIKQVTISGNKRVSEETIKIYGNIKIGKNYSEQDLDKVLNDLYSTNFFRDVRVELTNGNLKVNLIEYPVINTLILLGEKSNKYLRRKK